MRTRQSILIFIMVFMVLTACQPTSAADNNGLKVMATTSIVADVVQQIGGDVVNVVTLLPLGSDPHSFQPAPRDMAAVVEADVIFANGAGLEEFLQPLIESAGATARVVEVSDGIPLLEATEADSHAEGEDTGNPHTWVDPNNVLVWVENIRAALTELLPEHTDGFKANADAYTAKLTELDTWVRQQIETVPMQNRILVTDHMVYGYFAQRYGFEQGGALIPGFSTMSSASAQELAQIEDSIKAHNVRAIFIGESVTPALGQRVADDTGVKLVKLYHASLSEPGGVAPTYIDMIRYNVTVIVTALGD